MYGGPTPKRHVAYSNSPGIAKLDLGRLQGWTKKIKDMEEKGIPRVQTVIKYHDKNGRLRYKGCKALKYSESDTYLFITGHTKFRYGKQFPTQFRLYGPIFTQTPNLQRAFPRNYPVAFGEKLVSIFQRLISDKLGLPPLPIPVPSAEQVFDSLTFDDKWKDAEMQSVCHWLRGGKQIAIPQSFRDILPWKL